MLERRSFRATVDRIEGATAVLLPVAAGAAQRPFELPLELLPAVREGLTLAFTVEPDEHATAELAGAVKRLQDDLGTDDDGGGFEL